MRASPSLLVSALTLIAIAASARADDWSKKWPVNGKPELHVSAGDASIVVESGSGSEIEAELRTSGVSIGPSGVKITEHQDGNLVELDIRDPGNHFSWGNRSIELTVRVPQDLIANIRTGDGSIKLRGLHGLLNVSTGDGSVEGEELDGGLDAHSGDGSLHLRGRFDKLQVRTSDGSVDVQAVSGSRMSTDWRVETGDGSVRLNLPRNLSANVQLRTGDGSIHLDLPLSIEGTKEEHNIHGKLNGGGPYLDVHTGDGSISLGSTT